MKSIGVSIRNERRKKNITISQLAERSDLSKGFISQIERGIAQPSVTTLKKISTALGVSIVTLFSGHRDGAEVVFAESQVVNQAKKINYVQDVKIVRSQQRKKMFFPGSHIVYEMITPDLNRAVQILFLKCDPGEKSGDDPIADPTGEKCLFILNGSIEYKLENETYILEEGDSIYFPANLRQYWKGIGTEKIEVLIIMTPPWF
jgi:transcriptional regulator with XRE-family HTH domain